MHHTGRLWEEADGEITASPGSVVIDDGRVTIRMADVQVGRWAVRTVGFESIGFGRFGVSVPGGRLVFEPVDPRGFGSEARAVTLSNDLAEAATPAGLAVRLAPQQVVPAHGRDVDPRNPGLAAVLSVLWAGLGQFYNGNLPLAIPFALIQVVNLFLFSIGVGYVGFAVVAVSSVVQAFREADRPHRTRSPLRLIS